MSDQNSSNVDTRYPLALAIYVVCKNVGVLCFLVAFAFRLHTLRKMNNGQRSQKFFPWVRAILSLFYTAISLGIFIFNCANPPWPLREAYDYIFQGGGGEVIDSTVLIMQLVVLLWQLKKQQPYTFLHTLFLMFLAATTILRMILTIKLPSLQYSSNRTANLIVTCLLAAISVVQLIYWIHKQRLLPKFIDPKDIDFRQFLKNLLNREVRPFANRKQLQNQMFPFLIPLVCVEEQQIRISLELIMKGQVRDKFVEVHNQQQIKLKKNDLSSSKKESKFIASALFDKKQIEKLYISCYRFAITQTISIQQRSLIHLARQLQLFLKYFLSQKSQYHPQVLSALKMPQKNVENYRVLYQSCYKEEEGQAHKDKNAIYIDVYISKHLWVGEYYVFFMKVTLLSDHKKYYPLKRYSEIQALDKQLKTIIDELGLNLSLPELPKKYIFQHCSKHKIRARQAQLQKYLRHLMNDYTIIRVPELHQAIFDFLGEKQIKKLEPIFRDIFLQQGLTVESGDVSKALVGKQLVTFYDFKLMKEDMEVRSISRRYSDFQDLHQELKRWMNNLKATFHVMQIPQKLNFGSQSLRHQKLRNYLSNLVQLQGVGHVYAVHTFLNIGNVDSTGGRLSGLSGVMGQNISILKSPVKRQTEMVERVYSQYNRSSHFSSVLNQIKGTCPI